MFSIYLITNLVTGKKYVGYTDNIERRWASHRHYGSLGKGSCKRLYASMKKHGLKNFSFEILEEDIRTRDLARSREKQLIESLGTHLNGYNSTPGGTGGDMSDVPGWKEAVARYHESCPPELYATRGMEGKTHSEESRKKQSEARKKHWASLSEQELSARGKKLKGKRNGMFGKSPKNSRKIEFMGKVYASIQEASKETGHSPKFLKKHGKLHNE